MTAEKNRKVYINLRLGQVVYSFCWLSLLKDGSFSFGLSSKTRPFTDYGVAVYSPKGFKVHSGVITSGRVLITDAIHPHYTFHPPRINQMSGLVQLTGSNGMVDRWDVDWYPVNIAQTLVFAYTGDIRQLDRATKRKERTETVQVPLDVSCLRMELIVWPRETKGQYIDDLTAVTNVNGISPNYVLNCRFYKNDLEPLIVYVATDCFTGRQVASVAEKSVRWL